MITVAAPFFPPLFGLSWSPINCSYQDIDIYTGRVRYTTMVYWIPFKREIQHTVISKALEIKSLTSTQGNWKRVNTFSPGVRHSPNHDLHGAFSLIKKLELVWNINDFDSKARKLSAEKVLHLWIESGSNFGADEYIRNLSK